MNLPETITASFAKTPVAAVLTLENPDHAEPLAEALLAGGIRSIELTLRTDGALRALKAVCTGFPDIICGAGTVLTPDQVNQVKDAGAAFAVSPGLNPRVVRAAQNVGLPFAPGICTPSDIEGALELGCNRLKYFPAETMGGLKHLQSMAAPYLHRGVRFIPLGGLNEHNMADYLKDPIIAAIGGSWIAPKKLIDAGDWAGIESNARRAAELAAAIRPS